MSKKTLITALALILVCVVSVSGTLAYLSLKADNTNGGITNTFTAAADGKILDDADPENPDKAFEIIEPNVELAADGSYKEKTGTNKTGNAYEVAPGLKLPKAAKIRVVGKTDLPVYLYLEVVDTLSKDVFEAYALDGIWMPLKDSKGAQVLGLNKGPVYVYATGTETKTPALFCAEKDKLLGEKTFNIIDGGALKVKNSATADQLAAMTDNKLSFYSYMAQASAGDDAAAAFANCGFVYVEPEE